MWDSICGELPALVNMDGEEDMAELRAKPQLHWHDEHLQWQGQMHPMRRETWQKRKRQGVDYNSTPGTLCGCPQCAMFDILVMPRSGLHKHEFNELSNPH